MDPVAKDSQLLRVRVRVWVSGRLDPIAQDSQILRWVLVLVLVLVGIRITIRNRVRLDSVAKDL